YRKGHAIRGGIRSRSELETEVRREVLNVCRDVVPGGGRLASPAVGQLEICPVQFGAAVQHHTACAEAAAQIDGTDAVEIDNVETVCHRAVAQIWRGRHGLQCFRYPHGHRARVRGTRSCWCCSISAV